MCYWRDLCMLSQFTKLFPLVFLSHLICETTSGISTKGTTPLLRNPVDWFTVLINTVWLFSSVVFVSVMSSVYTHISSLVAVRFENNNRCPCCSCCCWSSSHFPQVNPSWWLYVLEVDFLALLRCLRWVTSCETPPDSSGCQSVLADCRPAACRTSQHPMEDEGGRTVSPRAAKALRLDSHSVCGFSFLSCENSESLASGPQPHLQEKKRRESVTQRERVCVSMWERSSNECDWGKGFFSVRMKVCMKICCEKSKCATFFPRSLIIQYYFNPCKKGEKTEHKTETSTAKTKR